ncbi:MAG: Modification methylase HaeIII [Nitrosomonadaceae bacterium]|nr:Modification methylase HaeIII [Nitrosomonadaceae bacterium]
MPTCVDLFAGCGGLSLGLEMADFEPLLFSEINKDAAATYKVNRSSKIVEVGDIYAFKGADIAKLKAKWKKDGIADVDVVAGGPPCQGYSGIGHRRTFNLEKQDIPSNQLFQQMIRVVKSMHPRIFLFENVGGLLTAKWTREGENGEIFRDVLQAFMDIKGYTVRWQYVQSKSYGVPQNRPRVLIVGIRNDLKIDVPPARPSKRTIIEPTAIADGLLPKADNDYPSIVELLSDLCAPNYKNGCTIDAYPTAPLNRFQKQLRTTFAGKTLGKGASLTDHDFSNHAPRIVEKFSYMIANDSEIPEHMRTKKFAQRVLPKKWSEKGPSITATSMPDDYVHYSQPRILSVREWARLQMFPDWYLFKGPRTTGGRRRAGDPSAGLWERDVPKYTQIGNAVPVELARKVGLHLASLLKRA